MNDDVATGPLLDLRECSLAELQEAGENEKSALAEALTHILRPETNGERNSFNSSI